MAQTILVTGANGHIGHGLIPALKAKGHTIISLDIVELDSELAKSVDEQITGSILDQEIINNAVSAADTIFHLASTLALSSELNPEEAHMVNATGMVHILKAALSTSSKNGKTIQIMYPSSIAVYSLPNGETRNGVVVTEDEYVGNPQTIYGITKAYCESLGSYYSDRYELLAESAPGKIDFRALRLPGIITDVEEHETMGKYAGLTMIHSPAEGGGFEMFIKPETVLPFITRTDAVKAFIGLSEAPKEKLKRRVYNVSGFSATVKELEDMITKELPDSQASENFDIKRQSIVDTWPQAIDDSKAKEDWGWKAEVESITNIMAS
jgi:threonine 3-dehydrogenase